MANRMKEDEKNERIIRGLLKLPANRRCINCNNLGPQYVCTNFRTFICTNCSGIHREFTHRVKSVSMAKFTTQEVIALKEGGNERAKEIYFKEWDTQRQSLPDSSNIDRVRDFIKHVYVDRRYTGEKNVDRPPRAKQGDGDDSSENRGVDSYRGGSRSPPYDDQYKERAGYGGRSVPRSPGYDSGDYKSSPGSFEAVDEKRRDDRFGNGNQNRRFEDRAFPDGVPKQGRSPNHQKEIDTSSPPMVRPVREILGDDMPALRIGPPPKSNGMRIPDSQRTSSSSSMGSSDGGSVQPKGGASSGSLIDFDADPEPAVPAAANQSVPHQTTSEPADGGNWASFDFSSQQIAPQVAENATTLESILGQLSAPASVPGGNTSTLPLSGVNSFPKSDNGVPTMQQQRPSVPLASTNQFTNELFAAPSVGAVNQRWGSPPATNFEAALTAPTGYPSQVAPRPPQEMSVSVPSQPPVEAKPVGRKALPEDLFASLYPLAPTSVPGWQGRPHPAMGYGMQYPTGVTMATFPPSSRPSNPFDFMNEPAPNQASMFPSVASLQEALPNLAQPSLLHTADSGTPSSHWMPSQQMSYPSAVSQSPYMIRQVLGNMPQQVPGNIPQQVPTNTIQMAYQGARGPGVEGAFFGAYGMDHHQLAPRRSQPGNSNSVGGNPFG